MHFIMLVSTHMKRIPILCICAFLLLCFLTGVAKAAPASDDYGKAQMCYKDLKADKKLARDSKGWVKCISEFKAVAEQYPKDPKAPEALFSAARLSRELSVQTGSTAYVEEAIHTYNTLIKNYPESSLADDALYQIGLLRRSPLKDDGKAQKAFEAILNRYPRGDMAPKATEALKSLGVQAGVEEGAAIAEKDVEGDIEVKESKEVSEEPKKQKEEPQKTKTDDGFRLSKLLRMNVDVGKTQTTVTLELDRRTPFTRKFIEYGQRTKTPARLTLQFPRTKMAAGISSQESLSSSHLNSIKIKGGVFTGELILRFDLKSNTAYDVIQKNEKTIIRFFPEGNMPALPTEEKTKKEGKKDTAKNSIRIVIDPGHGGRDTGAIGPGGVEEKMVTLALAKKLATELGDKLNATVYLTRTTDKDLPLEKRNAVANAKKADLFISIHANANKNRKISGIETYYLNNASDEAAKRLAQRENKSAAKPQGEVDKILLTLFQNYNTEESRVFADDVHKTMVSRLTKRYKDLKDHKVRSALFYVLVGAKCPGILVETSFISNPVEEKRLTNPNYQEHLADAIASGVERYVTINKDRIATL